MKLSEFVLCIVVVGIVVGSAGISLGDTVQADANGNLFINGLAVSQSPGSGQGVNYTLPFNANQGDVLIFNGAETDLIRFSGTSMEFYEQNGTVLSAAAAVGDANIKVRSTAGLQVGHSINIGLGANEETVTIAAVGTAGATGTGITLQTPLGIAHASGSSIQQPPLNLGDVAVLPTAVTPNVHLTLGAPTVWTPGATGIGGNASDPGLEYLFFAGNNPVSATPLPSPIFGGLALMIAVGAWKGWQTLRNDRSAVWG
jgi:hypothetical protein